MIVSHEQIHKFQLDSSEQSLLWDICDYYKNAHDKAENEAVSLAQKIQLGISKTKVGSL